MRRIMNYAFLLSVIITGCQTHEKEKYNSPYNDNNVNKPNVEITTTEPTNADTFKDSRDGQTYKWVRLKDGKKWMAQNLNYKTSDSWCYDNKDSNCREYGRLYNWEAAKKACPSGWHLPSDDEWRAMAKLYGGCDDDASDGGKAAYKALFKGGNTGFSALLGSSGYSGLGVFGLYWSSTEKNASYAWAYRFTRYGQSLLRRFYDKNRRRSCRCVQD